MRYNAAAYPLLEAFLVDTDLELDRDDINSLRQIMETTTSTSEMDLGLARLNWQEVAGTLREKYPKGIGKLCEECKMEAGDKFCNTGRSITVCESD